MKRLVKILLFSSLLALGVSAVSVPVTTQAATDFGYTALGTAVVTVKDTGAQIYNASGRPSGRFLAMNSAWQTNLENTLSSGSYYGVGTNEFVKASDVKYTMQVGFHGDGTQPAGNYDGVSVTTNGGAAIYNASGYPIGKTVLEDSNWKIDQINNVANNTYYRIGVGEYLSATDVRVYENTFSKPVSEVVRTKSGQPTPLYNDNGQLITDRTLLPNTSWYADTFSLIGGSGFIRVATDEYVSVAEVDEMNV